MTSKGKQAKFDYGSNCISELTWKQEQVSYLRRELENKGYNVSQLTFAIGDKCLTIANDSAFVSYSWLSLSNSRQGVLANVYRLFASS